jgi:hypothetical protein
LSKINEVLFGKHVLFAKQSEGGGSLEVVWRRLEAADVSRNGTGSEE